MARRASISCSCQLMSHIWYPDSPNFARETFKIQSPKPHNHLSLLSIPWISKFRPWNVQNPLSETSKTPSFGSLNLQIYPVKRSKSGPQNLNKQPLLGPWISKYRSWNVQNLVPKTSKSSTFGSLFWTGFWTFHGRNLEFRGPTKSSKWHKSVTIALVWCGQTDRRTDTQTDAHQIFGSLHNRPFGQKILKIMVRSETEN